MLEIEIDVFSGMLNPRFRLSNEEEQELVARIMTEPEQLAPVLKPTDEFGLVRQPHLVTVS